MFYFESDRQEILVQIKVSDDALYQKISAEIQGYFGGFVPRQDFISYDDIISRELKSCVRLDDFNELRKTVSWLTNFAEQCTTEISALKTENTSLRNELSKLRIAPDQSARISALEKTIAELQDKISAPPPVADQSARIAALEKTIAELQQKFSAPPVADQSARIAALRTENFNLRQEFLAETAALRKIIAELQQEISALKPAPAKPVEVKPAPVKPVEIPAAVKPAPVKPVEVKPAPPPEAIFFLPKQEGAFLPNDREKIPALIQNALNLKELEKFLAANPSDNSSKFQKLVANHLREVKRFADKLRLDDLDDEELSETVTAKYFKLFQRIIFDNFLVAVKRGLKSNAKFYGEMLRLLNEYLARCGIFTVDATAGRTAANEDYENMTAQILTNTDETLSNKISEIERLPYRINFLDEFGELKFLQYNGIMNVYKAV